MQIKEFARLCGLSPHTLRYYEHIGLMPAIDRTDSNHRRYSKQDLQWIAFIKRLKATNMPLAEMERYARLRAQGPATEQERVVLLEAHARRLEAAIAQEQEHLVALREKIRWYRAQIGPTNSP